MDVRYLPWMSLPTNFLKSSNHKILVRRNAAAPPATQRYPCMTPVHASSVVDGDRNQINYGTSTGAANESRTALGGQKHYTWIYEQVIDNVSSKLATRSSLQVQVHTGDGKGGS